MNGGWGKMEFKFNNESTSSLQILSIDGMWKVGDNSFGHWKQAQKFDLQAQQSKKSSRQLYMPKTIGRKSEELGVVPRMEGLACLSDGTNIPYSINIPVATLPHPLASAEGKYMRVELQEPTMALVQDKAKVLQYLDDAYLHMQELTGNTPFEGKTMIIRECPEHFAWAYAGNPIVLNTKYAKGAVLSFDHDRVSFGWFHEMGHNFDNKIGKWYIKGKGMSEFQANIKLAYAVEMMCTADATIKMKNYADGRTYNNEFYLRKCEQFLKTGNKSLSLGSKGYHGLFMTVIRMTSWDTLKAYYATYRMLEATGMAKPQGDETHILSYAILAHAAQKDLVPLYKEWGIPVDAAMINECLIKYQIQKPLE